MEQFSKTSNRMYKPMLNLTGWNSFQRLKIDIQAEEREFQTSVPCANLIKMKTHFQFILMNWNVTSSKMVRNNILEG